MTEVLHDPGLGPLLGGARPTPTTVQVVEEHLRRARSRDCGLVVDTDAARAGAVEADRHRATSVALGALHGMPFAFGADAAVAGWTAAYDDLAVQRIRQAGVVLMGRLAGAEAGADAVAAGVLPSALLDDRHTDRTLIAAAASRGLPALRPTPGRAPTWPVRNQWEPLVTTGPVGATVADVARLLAVLAGPDPRVPAALPEPGPWFAPPLAARLDGLRFAWALTVLGSSAEVAPEVAVAHEQAGRLLARHGAAVFGAAPDLTGAEDVAGVLRAWQRADHDGLSAADIAHAEEQGTALGGAARSFLERFDALLLPAHDLALVVTGCPVATVPVGRTDRGAPFGMLVVGAPGLDRRVLEIAAAIEAAVAAQAAAIASAPPPDGAPGPAGG